MTRLLWVIPVAFVLTLAIAWLIAPLFPGYEGWLR